MMIAAADAGAEREQHHAVRVLRGPDPELAVGGGVGVVLERGRLAERLLDVVADRHVLPRLEVRRVEDQPGLDVHEARAWRRRWRRCRPA